SLRGAADFCRGMHPRALQYRRPHRGDTPVVGVVLLVSAAVLMVDSRLRTALIAYLTFTGATLWLAFPHVVGVRGLALFALIAFVKLIVGPALILWIVRRYGVP